MDISCELKKNVHSAVAMEYFINVTYIMLINTAVWVPTFFYISEKGTQKGKTDFSTNVARVMEHHVDKEK